MKLLWIGDAVASTGFARSTHHILETVRHTYDVTVLGLNYDGGPHTYPYPIYPCWPGGDAYGIKRVKELVEKVQPDVMVIQQDPWNFAPYLNKIPTEIPVIGIVAVDGKNCRGTALNRLAHVIVWTQFAADEVARGGYTGPSTVIPLGVDLTIYHPVDRSALRPFMLIPEQAFVVGSVGRNQQRKRLDLTLGYFAAWVHTHRITNALLWLHTAPTSDQAYDLEQLARYYDIEPYVVLPEVEQVHGLSEAALAQCYNTFDVGLSTTQGEGFGLPTMEMLACGIPQIVPNWSGLGDLAKDVAVQVPCLTTAATPNCINVIGGVPDQDATVDALHALYSRPHMRDACVRRGLDLVGQPRFRWEHIGHAVCDVLIRVREQVMV